jgi:hypothetical protein
LPSDRALDGPTRRAPASSSAFDGIGLPNSDKVLKPKVIGRFKKFLKGRSSPSLVSHRQIDPRRTAVTSVNRGGRVRHADYEYGMRRAVNLVQDVMDFLNSALYFDYMVESLNVNPDLE